jgi:hypothetical protein
MAVMSLVQVMYAAGTRVLENALELVQGAADHYTAGFCF